jgi:hypothetical protein
VSNFKAGPIVHKQPLYRSGPDFHFIEKVVRQLFNCQAYKSEVELLQDSVRKLFMLLSQQQLPIETHLAPTVELGFGRFSSEKTPINFAYGFHQTSTTYSQATLKRSH